MTADLPFPFSGRPRCAKRPELECTAECEYGIAGPCGHEKLRAMNGSTRLRNTAIKQDPRAAGTVRGPVSDLTGVEASERVLSSPISHGLSALAREVCPMPFNRPNDERGRAVRARLAALVREYADAGRPLPRHCDFAAMLGISPSQITRHLNRLMDEGAFSPTCRHTRIYVGEVA